MTDPTLVHRALDYAAVMHRTQLRKSPEAEIPYMAHCAGVGLLLARHGFDDEVVAAGVLHDVIEDTEASADEIRERFGSRVAQLILDCSEQDKSLPWEERKARYIEHLRTASPDARAISACDKLFNMNSLINSAELGLNPFAQMKRGRAIQIDRFERFLQALGDGWTHALVDVVAASLDKLKRLTAGLEGAPAAP